MNAPTAKPEGATRAGKPRFFKDAREKKAHLWNRDALDWYVEEPRASDSLFAAEKFEGAIHDPSCGRGNIVLSALAAGYEATGSDIKRRVDPGAYWFTGEADFLSSTIRRDNIICNPPFFKAKGTEAFARQALSLARDKVAIFTNIPFLAGTKRAEGLFTEHPPMRVYIVTPRISCPPGEYLEAGGRATGGTEDWCWIIWQRGYMGRPTLRWLRREGK